MKKVLSMFLLMILCMLPLLSLAEADNTVVIYTSSEEYIQEAFRDLLNTQFPDYNIVVEYLPTGNHAAKLLAEGKDTPCDIIYDLETGYLEKLKDTGILADLSGRGGEAFAEDIADPDNLYFPVQRSSGCVVINTDLLEAKGLEKPQSYQELLNPEYKGLLTMPNPKSSGTGYMFLKGLVNAWGEDAAFDYFDAFAENVLQFTTSGSGSINAVVQGEAVIALGMTSQAVYEINNGSPLEILFFEEGSPYSVCGMAQIVGREDDPVVQEVFDFYATTLVHTSNEQFYPEKLFKDSQPIIENYPTDIPYMDMSNNSVAEKERLLADWEY